MFFQGILTENKTFARAYRGWPVELILRWKRYPLKALKLANSFHLCQQGYRGYKMFFDRYSRRRRWIVGFVAVTTAVVIMLLTPAPKMVSGELKMESTRKLSNFDIQWTNTLYQNNLKHIAFFFTFVKDWRCNVKFHKKCENTGKILKISCVRSNFVKFNIHFLRLPWEIYYRWLIISSALEECNIL